MKHSEILHPVRDALHEFEEAVRQHEHHRLLESKVVRQQAVDRARQHVLDAALELTEKAGSVE
ncbi:MAG: hypothetical protein O7I93_01695 [Gemmatimonadetes bacterium]|nr:hypothetical protein [Gemmatimonadota bacterium]